MYLKNLLIYFLCFLLFVSSISIQSENDCSLSGIPLTALYFDINSPVLASGDQSGMVRFLALIISFSLASFPPAYNVSDTNMIYRFASLDSNLNHMPPTASCLLLVCYTAHTFCLVIIYQKACMIHILINTEFPFSFLLLQGVQRKGLII